MEPLRRSPKLPPRLTDAVCMEAKSVIAGETAVLGISDGVVPYSGTSDDRMHACGDFDGATVGRHCDTSLDRRVHSATCYVVRSSQVRVY